MIIKDLVEYDIVNYKKVSMFVVFPSCTFKCEKECGIECCQNQPLIKQKNIEIKVEDVVHRYLNNDFTSAIVCGGLEPFDSWGDLYSLVSEIRKFTEDDIVIFTGYKENEIEDKINQLSPYGNIIVKFGRFIPGKESHFDELLGVNLASDNQYAKRI